MSEIFNVDEIVNGHIPSSHGETLHTLQRRLYTKILSEANKHRFNKITTGSRLSSTLMDISGYSMKPITTINLTPSTENYNIGNLGGLELWVDPNMKWTDDRIILSHTDIKRIRKIKLKNIFEAESNDITELIIYVKDTTNILI